MAIAYTKVAHGVGGNFRINIYDITLDGSYAAGGYTITPASVGVSTIYGVAVVGSTVDTGVHAKWIPATGKLQLHKGASTVTVTSGNAELTELATNDTVVSASDVIRLVIYGDFSSGRA